MDVKALDFVVSPAFDQNSPHPVITVGISSFVVAENVEAHGEGGQIVGTLKPRVPASSEQERATDYLRSSWQLQTTDTEHVC